MMSAGKILVVDDDQNICELLRLYIEKKKALKSVLPMTVAKHWRFLKSRILI